MKRLLKLLTDAENQEHFHLLFRRTFSEGQRTKIFRPKTLLADTF